MRRAWLVCFVAQGCVLVIKEPACTDIAAVSVNLKVQDEDGRTIPDATARWGLGGAATEGCDDIGGGRFHCGYEVRGDITLRVEAPGYAAFDDVVSVSGDRCHVDGEQVTATLSLTECTDLAAPSVLVTVEGSTGEVLDGVDVTWREESSVDEQPCTSGASVWACGGEVPGRLVVTATAAGHETVSETVEVEADECHVLTEEVTLLLDWLPD